MDCPRFEDVAAKRMIKFEESKTCCCGRSECPSYEDYLSEIRKRKGDNAMSEHALVNAKEMNVLLRYCPRTNKISFKESMEGQEVILIIDEDTAVMCPTSKKNQCCQRRDNETTGNMITNLGLKNGHLYQTDAIVEISPSVLADGEGAYVKAISITFITSSCPFYQYCWDHGAKEPLPACTPTAVTRA